MKCPATGGGECFNVYCLLHSCAELEASRMREFVRLQLMAPASSSTPPPARIQFVDQVRL